MDWVNATALCGVLAVTIVVVVVYARAARERRELLKAVADDLGCPFHGTSFRGRFLARAVRGDAVDVVPSGPTLRDGVRAESVVVMVALGAMLAFRAIAAALRASAAGTRMIRLRVELTTHGRSGPDVAKALAAVRSTLRDTVRDEGAFDVRTVGGTELLVILRGEAATVPTARRVVELAIEQAG